MDVGSRVRAAAHHAHLEHRGEIRVRARLRVRGGRAPAEVGLQA